MRAAEESEELVEAAFLRMELRIVPEMPFSDQTGCVTRGPEAIRQRRLGERQADVCTLGAGVELMAEARLVPAGQEPGSCRRAIRSRDIAVRASGPRVRQRIDVRGRDVLASVHTEVGVAQVVRDDDDDVRLAISRDK